MAVAIALDKAPHPASPDAQTARPAASANLSSPRGNSPFAALLAKAQAHGTRRAGAPRTPPATPSRSNQPESGDAGPSPPNSTAKTPQATPQKPDANTSTAADSTAKTPDVSAHNAAGTLPAHGTAGSPAEPHAATNTASKKSALDVTDPPAPVLPTGAAVPDLTQDAAVGAAAQDDPDTADPSVSEQTATVAATSIPVPETIATASDDADPPDDPEMAASGSPATTSSKAAILLPPASPGQDANTVDGVLLLHAMPADTAASSPSPQAVAPPAAPPPGSSEWAEARETVALRMAHAVQDGVQNVSIDLHPAELGHVGIELSFHAGGVSVQMTISRQDTYDAFSRDRAALEQQLAQSGINLGGGGLDLRFDQKREQPTSSSQTSSAARIQPLQPDAAARPAARPRIANGLLNIIA